MMHQCNFFKIFTVLKPVAKTFITVLFFSFCFKSACAQNVQIDSLNKLISKAATDTARINLVNRKITVLSAINIDTAISMGQINIEEAKKINYKKGEADARIQLVNNYCMKGKFTEAAENLKTSEELFKKL